LLSSLCPQAGAADHLLLLLSTDTYDNPLLYDWFLQHSRKEEATLQ
jgi:hypothetical protein